MTILFTPAGDTDPVRGFRDGAILHILRHYPQVEKVILFLTKEMEEKENKDHVYTKGIASVRSGISVELIPSGITAPHRFDNLTWIQDTFETVYHDHQYPADTEWLLNISSGTPQMKTVMALLSLDYARTKAIQVDSPEHKSNRQNHPEPKTVDLLEMIDDNEDRMDPTMPNRCSEPPLLLLKLHSLKKQLISLIDNYEYAGALQLLKLPENRGLFSKDTEKLLQHAVYRRDLMWKEANKVIANYEGKPLIPNPSDFSEYFQVMEMRQRKKQYPEFIVKLSPILMGLGMKYMEKLENNGQFLLSRCGEWRKGAFYLKNESIYLYSPQLLAYMEMKIGRGRRKSFRDDFIYFSTIVMICDYLRNNELSGNQTHATMAGIFSKLRLAEEKTRNLVAHEITNLTDDKIRELTALSGKNEEGIPGGLTSKDIMELLRQAVKLIYGQPIKWTYDELNAMIISSLK